ncbi:MAG: phosphatidylglycerophosphatase A [Gammaproteobacteria bacterium]
MRSIWKNPIHFIAFGFGSGAIPFAPGTWGTIAALPIYFLIQDFSLSLYLTLLLLATGFGIWICDVTEKDLGVPDHSGIVWDEIVGYLCTMILAPKGWGWILLGFILFRIFDILKPWPISWVERHVKGGLGIMVDDILAAVPAWIILQMLAWIILF